MTSLHGQLKSIHKYFFNSHFYHSIGHPTTAILSAVTGEVQETAYSDKWQNSNKVPYPFSIR